MGYILQNQVKPLTIELQDFVYEDQSPQNVFDDITEFANDLILEINSSLVSTLEDNAERIEFGLRLGYWDAFLYDLRIRNVLYLADGTVALPSLTFYEDQDSGLYRWTAGGVSHVGITIDATKLFDISGTAIIINDDGDDVDFTIEGDVDTGLFVCDGGTNMVLMGSTANNTDFPRTKLFVSSGDTTETVGDIVGIVGEAASNGTFHARGVSGVSRTNGAFRGQGVFGRGMVSNTADTADSVGVLALANDTHAGGPNYAIRSSALNGATNFSFYGTDGDLYNSGGGEFALPADRSFIIDGRSTVRLDNTPVMDVNVTINTTTATDDVPVIDLDILRDSGDTGGTHGLRVGMGTSNMANTEWSFVFGATYDTSNCATATSNCAAFYAGTPSAVSASCNDYGVYVATGYDIAGYFDGVVLVGANANLTDFANAQAVISQGNTGDSNNNNLGLVAEAITDGALGCAALYAYGGVTAGADTGIAYGIRAYSEATHGGGDNIAILAGASNGAVDYSLYGVRGRMRSNLVGTPIFANNAAAVAGGLTVGTFYRTGADPDLLCIVH